MDTSWHIEEFGYCQPDLAVDAHNPPGDAVTVERDTIYRNVDAFCERIKDVIAIRGNEIVRDNLHLCLRGSVNRWWIFEISKLDK